MISKTATTHLEFQFDLDTVEDGLFLNVNPDVCFGPGCWLGLFCTCLFGKADGWRSVDLADVEGAFWKWNCFWTFFGTPYTDSSVLQLLLQLSKSPFNVLWFFCCDKGWGLKLSGIIHTRYTFTFCTYPCIISKTCFHFRLIDILPVLGDTQEAHLH